LYGIEEAHEQPLDEEKAAAGAQSVEYGENGHSSGQKGRNRSKVWCTSKFIASLSTINFLPWPLVDSRA